MRCACVEIPELRLQILLRDREDIHTHPVAVVEQDRPSARILELNDLARGAGLYAGMPYTLAHSLLPELHAHTVQEDIVTECLEDTRTQLYSYTPGVEVWQLQTGVFWLDIRGIARLWGSVDIWASAVYEFLGSHGFRVRMSLGFSRFGSYVMTRSMKERYGLQLSHSRNEQTQRVEQASIACLPIEPRAKARLRKLGITSVRRFLDIPAPDIAARFGRSAYELHSFAHEESSLPVQNFVPEHPVDAHISLPCLVSSEQILDHIQSRLEQLLNHVRNRGFLVRSLKLTLNGEDDSSCTTEIIPSEPACDFQMFMKLLRIRLQAIAIPARMEAAFIQLETTSGHARTLDLFDETFATGRQRNSALALIQAELGNDAVQRIVLRDSHIPEERFLLVSTLEASARPAAIAGFTAQEDAGPVRRIFAEPLVCSSRELFRDADLLSGPLRYAPRWWTADNHGASKTRGRTYYILGRRGKPEYWCFSDGQHWWVHGLVQ